MKTANANPDPKPEEIVMWVIYFNALDYPGKYVMRKHVGMNPQAEHYVRESIEELQYLTSLQGLTCIGRMEGDEAHIVEVWL